MSDFWPMPAGWDQIFVGLLIVTTLIFFVKEWIAPDLVALGALGMLLAVGILKPEDLPGIFGNEAPVTIACLFIISAALERTGSIELIGRWLDRMKTPSEVKLLLIVALIVIPCSAFVNNTPIVVIFLPLVLAMCRKSNIAPSRQLIPLSYFAVVGGLCTMVGTSTNVIVSGIVRKEWEKNPHPGLEPFHLFEISSLGVIFCVATLVFVVLFRKVLPKRHTLASLIESEASREFLTEAVITEESPLAGKAFTETSLAKMRDVRVIQVLRHGHPLKQRISDARFEPGDQILFKTHVGGVIDLSTAKGLEMRARSDLGLEAVHTEKAVIVEGILGRNSPLVGKSLAQVGFRQKYGVIILAVHRHDTNLQHDFENLKLAFGDTLLLEGPREDLDRIFSEKDFINLSEPKHTVFRRSKAPLALGAMALLMVLGALEARPFSILAMLVALLVLLTRCIEPRDAYASIEWSTIFMIIGTLGLGEAMRQTGAAATVAGSLVEALGGYPPWIMLAAVYLLTLILTELLSNTAVAALMTPLVVPLAVQLGVSPRPFIVAVMFAASAGFATPIGYQTNMLVYGAGGYKFADFLRIGLPLDFLLWAIGVICIPIFWPF